MRIRGDEPGRFFVFKEKHGTRYYDASTMKRAHGAALQVLKDRTEEGWYEDYELDDPKSQAESILAQQDGNAALDFLSCRSDGEYESFELEYMTIVE